MADYTFDERLPTPGEHRALMRSVGWADHVPDGVLLRSLENSLHGVVALADDEPVAMARLVGDGVHYFYVQDVVVHPHHNDSGLGTQLTQRLLDWVDARAGSSAFVGLFASPDAASLYESLGFSTADMTGMHLER